MSKKNAKQKKSFRPTGECFQVKQDFIGMKEFPWVLVKIEKRSYIFGLQYGDGIFNWSFELFSKEWWGKPRV